MKSVFLFPLLMAVAAAQIGCSSVRRVDAPTFIKYGEATRMMNSATDYELVGVRDGNALIRYWTAIAIGGSKTVTYWIPLSELPVAMAEELKAGRNPWGPTWKDRIRTNPASKAPEPTP